ncbi:MAG: hypothetical protein HOC74_06415 [Gemmatimonadetes bacterium]|jgi:hypothetical protein|nr:hypothetical protein [Gemmatimonadota bacterium]
MSEWMERLNQLGILDDVPVTSTTTIVPTPVDDGAEDIPALKIRRPSSPHSGSGTDVVAPYRGLTLARDWLDLERILDVAQDAYEAGDLSIVVVEDLAIQAAEKAQVLPVAAMDIWVNELLGDGPMDTCFCCGRSSWWRDRHGNRKCGICHPQTPNVVPI